MAFRGSITREQPVIREKLLYVHTPNIYLCQLVLYHKDDYDCMMVKNALCRMSTVVGVFGCQSGRHRQWSVGDERIYPYPTNH